MRVELITVTDAFAMILFIERESNNATTAKEIKNRFIFSEALRNLIKFSDNKEDWIVKGKSVKHSSLTNLEKLVYELIANMFAESNLDENNFPYTETIFKMLDRLKAEEPSYYLKIKERSISDYTIEDLGIQKTYNLSEKIEIASKNIDVLQKSLAHPANPIFKLSESDASFKADKAIEYLEEALAIAKEEKRKLSLRKSKVKNRILDWNVVKQLHMDFPECKFNVTSTSDGLNLYLVSSPENLSHLIHSDKVSEITVYQFTNRMSEYFEVFNCYVKDNEDANFYLGSVMGDVYTQTT